MSLQHVECQLDDISELRGLTRTGFLTISLSDGLSKPARSELGSIPLPGRIYPGPGPSYKIDVSCPLLLWINLFGNPGTWVWQERPQGERFLGCHCRRIRRSLFGSPAVSSFSLAYVRSFGLLR